MFSLSQVAKMYHLYFLLLLFEYLITEVVSFIQKKM